MKSIMPGLARDGITINMVLPGLFTTGRVTGASRLVAFFASRQASYITGAVYQVDGGLIKSVW
jgi:NAD(P)-dependent dehydrogenase (short-subunit alcohol dehydrogenase family)